MAVYFIQDSATGFIKIGHTANAWHRMSKIQSDCPGQLTMLALEEGGEPREAELHQRFAQSRERGEWFSPTLALRTYIAELGEPQRPKHFKTPKAEMIARLRQITGEKFQTIDSWLERDRIPSQYWTVIVAAGVYTLEDLAERAARFRKAG